MQTRRLPKSEFAVCPCLSLRPQFFFHERPRVSGCCNITQINTQMPRPDLIDAYQYDVYFLCLTSVLWLWCFCRADCRPGLVRCLCLCIARLELLHLSHQLGILVSEQHHHLFLQLPLELERFFPFSLLTSALSCLILHSALTLLASATCDTFPFTWRSLVLAFFEPSFSAFIPVLISWHPSPSSPILNWLCWHHWPFPGCVLTFWRYFGQLHRSSCFQLKILLGPIRPKRVWRYRRCPALHGSTGWAHNPVVRAGIFFTWAIKRPSQTILSDMIWYMLLPSWLPAPKMPKRQFCRHKISKVSRGRRCRPIVSRTFSSSICLRLPSNMLLDCIFFGCRGPQFFPTVVCCSRWGLVLDPWLSSGTHDVGEPTFTMHTGWTIRRAAGLGPACSQKLTILFFWQPARCKRAHLLPAGVRRTMHSSSRRM